MHARACELERAAGFARQLIRYMDDADLETAGEALQVASVRRTPAAEWES